MLQITSQYSNNPSNDGFSQCGAHLSMKSEILIVVPRNFDAKNGISASSLYVVALSPKPSGT
jgi:hypothetical protein